MTAKYILHGIPNGGAGTRATLAMMEKIVRKWKKSPLIRELALQIVEHVPEKKFKLEAAELLDWVQDNVRYVKDINGIETLHEPNHILRLGQGDCDDQSILLAALLESIGHPARFIAVGFTPQSFSHVLVQTKIGRDWINADPITDWPLGRGPSHVKKIMRHHIRK